MRSLSFLLGVALFIVAGFSQNALIGIGGITLSILAMLWPAAPHSRDEDRAVDLQQHTVYELSPIYLLLRERAAVMLLLPEATLDNQKVPDPGSNSDWISAGRSTRRNLDE